MSNPMILIETTSGDILAELYAEKAPMTVENFLQYVDEGFYENTIFHRVIKDFMIQGGGLTLKLEEKSVRAPITNEATNGVKNVRGTLAMARSVEPDSASAQFFINVVDNPELDHTDTTHEGYGYAVFGEVIEGMDTVDKIAKEKTRTVGDWDDVPADSVLITAVSRFEL